MKTLLIDYGSGNLHSAHKALEAAGFNTAPHSPQQLNYTMSTYRARD